MATDTGYKIRDQYGTHFVTFTVVGWVDIFTRQHCRDIVMDALSYCVANKGLVVYAYVIMGSHLHLVIRAQKESKGLSAIIRDFKTFTSKSILAWVLNSPKESRRAWLDVVFKYHAKYNKRNKEYQFWIQNNHPKHCFSADFTLRKIRYIHNNPVVAGIVDTPSDYLYSSARNYEVDGKKPLVDFVQVIDLGLTND